MPDSQREICLIHANCLGDPLARLLEASPFFQRRYQVVKAVNYTREAIPDALLARCSLFLYQHLSAKWEELASQRLVSLLPSAARAIRLPVPVFRGYWPFWTNRSPMQFADVFLERLLGTGLAAQDMLLLYVKRGALAACDLDAPALESLALLRAAEAEGALPCADFIATWWRRIQVFNTINHPAPPLLRHIAEQTLLRLGLPPLGDVADALDVSCDEGGPTRFEQPIHPQVGQRHGLAFANETRAYRVFGTRMTFAAYTACYLDCRLLNRVDFVSYLRQVSGDTGETDIAAPRV